MKTSFGAGVTSGNRARVGRAHRRLKTTFVFLTAFLSFWCGRAVPSLEHIWRMGRSSWRHLPAWKGKRTGDISETFKYFALQQRTRHRDAVSYHASWQQSLTASCVVTALKMFVSQFLVSCCLEVVPCHVDG